MSKLLPYLLALGCVLLAFEAWSADRDRDAVAREARMWEDSAAFYSGRVAARDAENQRLSAETESAKAVADSLAARVPKVVTRWRMLPDAASAETVRAAADTAISACTAALDACAMARQAQALLIGGLQRVNAERRAESDALRQANAALKRSLNDSAPLVRTGLMAAIGCGAAQLAGEPCLLGTFGGVAVDAGWRAIEDYKRAEPW